MPQTKYSMDSDYEISATCVDKETKKSCSYQPLVGESKIRRTFNFLARQVTTVITESIYQNTYHSTGYAAGHSSLAMHTDKESFADFSEDEIKYMHEKLRSLGGKPPAINEVLSKCIPGRKNSFS